MWSVRKSFRGRVSLWSVCVSGLALLIFVTGSSIWIRHEFLELIETNASSLASVAAIAVEGGVVDLNRDLGTHREEQYKVAAVVGREGDWLFSDETLWSEGTDRVLAEGGAAFSPDGFWRIRLYERSGYKVFIAASLAESENEYLEFVVAYAMGLPLALLLVAWGGWWLGGRATRPIRSISAAISKVTPGGLDIRVLGVEREDEIGELARLTNGMLERVEKGFVQARRFTGDASHELRTPLAILQSELEQRIQEADASGADQGSNGRMLDEVRRLKALTNSLLFLARVDAGTLEIGEEEVVLKEILEEIVDEVSCERFGEGLEWELVCPEGASLRGEPNLLRQLLRNLLRNAGLYNREGGRVRCEILDEGCQTVARIGNTGDGIPSASRERLFDRFFRCDTERSRRRDGFGLGLNISRAIAEAHGGQLVLGRCVEDWTEFEVVFPKS